MNEEFTAPPPPDQAGIGVYNNPLRKRPVEPNNPTGGSRPFKLRKPTERTFSEKLTQIIPESKLYNELLETEKRLDAIMLRKRLGCQDARGKPSRVYRTVRVFVSNTASNQSGSHPDGSGYNPECPPSWILKVEGRMLDIPAVHSKHKHPISKVFHTC
ncbi:SWI/SNF and RSC complex subunit Ssr3 [Entomophthora muscae]|uniref:SWI/SNF and RSC complex subunit Ssr3 n=1 Tax=Entomophthora muscae TaxID=34485 RepID=A0ACC2UJT4_9FUNG|nr:SWI/SNF and RSC complex subunit Ssr3 [Entomophthora muscae]